MKPRRKNCKKTTCKDFNETLVSRQRIGWQADKINFQEAKSNRPKEGLNDKLTCHLALFSWTQPGEERKQ